MNTLRDYQQEMLGRLREAWKRHRGVMVQMPTGTGKTHLMAAVIREWLDGHPSPAEVLVVAHRRELLEQVRQTLAAFGLPDAQVRVESIQRLSRHMDGMPYSPGLAVIDEAHHAPAGTYRALWDRWPGTRFLGLTATPCRLDGEPFTGLFGTLLQSWPIQSFIDRGWLSDFEYVSAGPDSRAVRQVRLLRKRGADGDYQTRELSAVLDVPESIAHLYETYSRFARGRKGIVYAVDRGHARHIADCYASHGVRCAVIDARTPAGERSRTVLDYLQGRTDVLVNVDIFSEGFDCPEVEFIQLARPTLSLSKYLQQVGRGMRVSEGKSQVLILDNVGLYQHFGLPTADRDWRRLFLGMEAGKGMQGVERLVVVADEGRDGDLAGLEMVSIKSGGERRSGLELFLQDGMYGVMRNGRITCPARFKRVRRLQDGCGFFALGIYLAPNRQNYGRPEEVTTVIDRFGRDLSVKLYGKVQWEDGCFCGEVVGANFIFSNYWDPVGNAYYDLYPDFTKVAGVEIANTYEHNSTTAPCRRLRMSTGRVSPRFHVWDMYYNKDIIVARDYLVVKKDRNHSYRIKGYLGDSILVECEDRYGYEQIMPDGRKGKFFTRFPKEATHIVNHRLLGLQKVHTG